MIPINKSSIEFTDEVIQQLFGSEDAESEPIERLRQYYFKNEIYTRVTSDLPIRILVGHKGIGKSALFKFSIAEEEDKGNVTILIRPDDIAELGKSDENFLLKVKQWKVGLIKIIGKKVFNEFGIDDETILSQLSKFGLKLISFLSDSVVSVKDTVNLQPTQKVLMENFLKSKKIIVYIDDLDRGWEGNKDDIMRLSSLLNSIRDLSNENHGLRFRVAFRSDVFFLVRTADESADKIELSVVWYSWTNHEILVMLIKRILTFFGEPVNEPKLLKTSQSDLAFFLDRVLARRFFGYGKWENIPMYRILMTLIRKRPRDLVKLCAQAAREAYKDKSRIIETKHFTEVFEEYSLARIQDTINEYRSELPNIEKLLFGMKPTKKEKLSADAFVLTSAELHNKIGNILLQNRFSFANGREASAKDLAHFLYKSNFLTARKNLEDGEIHRKYFEENRYLSNSFVDFGYDWEVHPAYRWALQPDSLRDIFNKLPISADR